MQRAARPSSQAAIPEEVTAREEGSELQQTTLGEVGGTRPCTAEGACSQRAKLVLMSQEVIFLGELCPIGALGQYLDEPSLPQ